MTIINTSRCLVTAAVAAAAACASTRTGTAAQPSTTGTSAGVVATQPDTTIGAVRADTNGRNAATSIARDDIGALDDTSTATWLKSLGGFWMDSSGLLRMGGATGTPVEMSGADLLHMTNANIVAHLTKGDSLEITLSQSGFGRATDPKVREFAQRMVNEHSAHVQKGLQMAMQNGIGPVSAPIDTADAMMASRMASFLASAAPGANYDRQLMSAEVVMHRHMLSDLNALRPQATGTVQQFIDQTIPVVQMHLKDAKSLLADIGGGVPGTR